MSNPPTASHPLRLALWAVAFAGAALATHRPAAAADLNTLPGISVSASSCYLNPGCVATGPWSAANAIDGKEYDRTPDFAWNAGSHAPHWLRVDFPGEIRLDALRVSGPYNAGVFNGLSTVYEIWTAAGRIASGTLIDSADPAQNSDSFAWAVASAPVTDWLEYRVVGGTHWANVGELTMSGERISPVPEPSSLALALGGAALLLSRRWRHARRPRSDSGAQA
jgi:hypothetical protein